MEVKPAFLAAAALHYAIQVTGMMSVSEYHHGWEKEVGLTDELLAGRG